MAVYIISYDVLEKKPEDTCNETTNSDFREILIGILCEVGASNIEWENQTTISFHGTPPLLHDVADKIDELEFCVDYHLSRVRKDDGGTYNIRKNRTQEDSIENFKKDVNRLCD